MTPQIPKILGSVSLISTVRSTKPETFDHVIIGNTSEISCKIYIFQIHQNWLLILFLELLGWRKAIMRQIWTQLWSEISGMLPKCNLVIMKMLRHVFPWRFFTLKQHENKSQKFLSGSIFPASSFLERPKNQVLIV